MNNEIEPIKTLITENPKLIPAVLDEISSILCSEAAEAVADFDASRENTLTKCAREIFELKNKLKEII